MLSSIENGVSSTTPNHRPLLSRPQRHGSLSPPGSSFNFRNQLPPSFSLRNSDWNPFSTVEIWSQACLDYGFFYLINHGVEETLLERVFDESRKFFSLPVEEKMKLVRKEHRGYTALYAEKLDPTASTDKGFCSMSDLEFMHCDFKLVKFGSWVLMNVGNRNLNY